MRSVRPVLRVDGYVRVSRVGYREGERFISPSVQREQIRGWAKGRPATLLEVWEELDESGGRGDRPLLETAVERIENGLSQGLVVASVDRFGRSLVHGLAMIERIERADGAFISVRDGFDLTTDTGRLVLRILLSMGEWYRDRTRAGWEVAIARAVARGVWIASHVPVGYRKLRSGRLRLDPATAPFVSELFERRAQGETLRSLARFLEANEVRTSYGNPGWGNPTIGNVVANRVYLGEVRWGRYVREGAHEAVTDEATWQAAQLPKRTVHARRENPALLSGLVRCASCGRSMRTAPYGGPGRVAYSCHRITRGGDLPGTRAHERGAA